MPESPARAHPLARAFLSPAGRGVFALMLVLLGGAVFHAEGAFFDAGTHRDALRHASVYGILACGMTLVIITGGIDLAVGSILALCAVVVSKLAIHEAWPAYVAAPAAIAVGAACGAVSGGVVALRVQPFIATLAMMVFARGLAKWVSGGAKVSTAVENPDRTYSYVEVPELFNIVDSYVLGDSVSIVTLIFLVCAVAAWLLLARHRVGRQLYAIGGNEEAARLSGIPVNSTRIIAYTMSGVFAGIAGICHAAQSQQGDPEAAIGYELTAIAMVVIGGTSLMGGRGGVGLTVIGVLTIGYLEKILSINAVPESGRLMLTGLILVVAVLAQRRRRY